MNKYTSDQNSRTITQLNRLTIARVTSRKRVKATAYTPYQLLNIQRLANRLSPNKDIVIAYDM